MTGRPLNGKKKRALESLRKRQRAFRARQQAKGVTRITVWARPEDVEGLKLAAGEGRAFSRLRADAMAALADELRGRLAKALDEWVGDGTKTAASERIVAAFNAAAEAKETLDLRLNDLVRALDEALAEESAGEGAPARNGEGASLEDLMRVIARASAAEEEK